MIEGKTTLENDDETIQELENSINGTLKTCQVHESTKSKSLIDPNVEKIVKKAKKESTFHKTYTFDLLKEDPVVKAKKMYKCPICDKIITHSKNLKEHIAVVHEGKKWNINNHESG